MLRLLAAFLFLGLTADNGFEIPYGGLWKSPLRPIGDLLFLATPVKAPGIALIVLAFLAYQRGKSSAKRGRIKALDSALWLNIGGHLLLLVWGALNGGSLMHGVFQIQNLLFLPICGFMFIATVRTESDFRTLGKVIVYAAIFRGVMATIFCFVIVPQLGVEKPPTMTTHADTVLFTTAVVILISWALEERTRKPIVRALFLIAFLMFAIQINNRRLAYVSLGSSVLVLYFLLESDALKRRLNRTLLMLTPLGVLYLAVGWNATHPIFKPAKSVASVIDSSKDTSAKTRDIENYNLIVTLKPQMLAGSGWGHEYNEVSVAYSIAEVFSLYKYIPHNSLLGIWAFTGYLGSTALWIMFVVSAYLSTRAYRLAQTPLGRTICAVSVCEIVIYSIQAFGDMGIMAWTATLVMGLSFAAASRMAFSVGALSSTSA